MDLDHMNNLREIVSNDDSFSSKYKTFIRYLICVADKYNLVIEDLEMKKMNYALPIKQ